MHSLHHPLHLRIHALFVYPIKACSGVRVPQLCFTEDGRVRGDREWVVVDADHTVVWQGAYPRLALVRPQWAGAQLCLAADGEATLAVASPGVDRACTVRIWNDTAKVMESFAGRDAGHDAAQFLERVTTDRLRLVQLEARAVARDAVNPVHLTSLPSLAELNQMLASRGMAPAGMERFRPNVVLMGDDPNLLPFIEEQVSSIAWGPEVDPHRLTVSGKCVRCIVPNVDPASAEVGDEPLQSVSALSAQRYPGEPSYFGVYARPSRPALLSQDDALVAELDF